MTNRGAAVTGLALHACVGVVPFATTFLVAPVWASAVLAAWWGVLAGVAIRTSRSRPSLTPVIPAIAVLMWGGVMAVGELLVDWNV